MTEVSTRASRRRSSRSRRATAALGAAAALGALVIAKGGPDSASASSHREAPLIAGDPRADNTDLYAFVSPDKQDTVTLISNWIPFEEPNGGPNFYPWAEDTRYNIKVDNDGDARADLTYTWVFTTHIRNPDGHFLSNTGPVTSLTDPDLNVYQTYDLTLTNNDTNTTTVLAQNALTAPSIAGAASMPDYAPLRNEATITLAGNAGKAYAGQADDPFFLDLRVFDLLYGGNASELGTDTLAGYNVNTVALQVPKTALAINGNATRNPVIGVWSTTDRRSAGVAGPNAPFVQVSRLGNPLVNEVVVPLALKDAFNTISPDVDRTIPAVVDKVERPILPGLIQAIYGVPAPATPRNDLTEIFLQGISKANAGLSGNPRQVLDVDLNAPDLNADALTARGNAAAAPSEMLRLNMAVPVAAQPKSYGVLAGDVQGFPNGRRLTDDVVDIAVQAVEGAAQSGQLVKGLAVVDSVDRNDRPFGATFPYVALPNVSNVNNGTTRSPRAPELIAENPKRILDTRPGVQIGFTGAKPAAGQVVKLAVTSVAGAAVPTDARAVYLNVTAVNTDADGFVTAYACDSPRPNASSFNPLAGAVTSNLIVAPLAADGSVCLYTSSATDLLADLSAYHPSTSVFVPTAPERLLETRAGAGQKGYSGAKPADGAVVTLHVTQTGTAQVPADALAVFLNVTAVNAAGGGWVTAYPCGTTPPNTSNINLLPGAARAALVPVKIGSGGDVCLSVSRSTDLIADLQGYAPAGSRFVATTPERLLDSRPGAQQVGYSGAKPIAGQTIELRVTGVGSTKVPANAGAVLLNLTATDSTAGGFATVFPCGSARPNASNLNYGATDVANMVAAKIGDGGRVCVYTSAPVHLIADISGYFPDTVLAG